MSTTNFMGLTLPTVSISIGPTWANQINTAIESIDSHNHSSGFGAQVPTSGLNINANLDFGGYKPYNLLSTQFTSNDSTLTGASNANSCSVTSGDLYFTNSAGNSVQITDGGAVVTSAGALSTVERQAVSGNVTIGPSDTFVFLAVDTTAARQITLPLANSVASGRCYILKDISGSANTNNITVVRQGSDTIDGETSYVYNSNYGSIWCVGDGTSSWDIA